MLEFSVLKVGGLFISGLLIGAISSAVGIGGGIITVPILMLVYGLKGDLATATSLGVIIFTAFSGTLAYIRERRIDFQVARYFMIFAVPGSLAGGLLSLWLEQQQIETDIFQVLFALTMTTIASFKILSLCFKKEKDKDEINKVKNLAHSTDELSDKEEVKSLKQRLMVFREFKDRHNIEFSYTARLFPGIIIAFMGGLIGALLGLGGGVVYVPILTMAIGVPTAIASATSTFTIFIANFFAVFLRLGSIQWDYVLWLAAGTLISASIVPRIIYKVKSETIIMAFWVLTILAAFKLLAQVLGVF